MFLPYDTGPYKSRTMALSPCPWPEVFLAEFPKSLCQGLTTPEKRQAINEQGAKHGHDVICEEVGHLEIRARGGGPNFRAGCGPSGIQGSAKREGGEEEDYVFAVGAEGGGGKIAVCCQVWSNFSGAERLRKGRREERLPTKCRRVCWNT